MRTKNVRLASNYTVKLGGNREMLNAVPCQLARPAAESRHGGLYILLLFLIYF